MSFPFFDYLKNDIMLQKKNVKGSLFSKIFTRTSIN